MVTANDIKALNEFISNRSVDYVLTGTAALYYHGALPTGEEAHDIDILVLSTEETEGPIRCMFQELQDLSGLKASIYPNCKCFNFKVGTGGVNVNAIVTNDFVPHRPMRIDGEIINVQGVFDILSAKFKLGRQKDYNFFAKLVGQLTSYFPCLKR